MPSLDTEINRKNDVSNSIEQAAQQGAVPKQHVSKQQKTQSTAKPNQQVKAQGASTVSSHSRRRKMPASEKVGTEVHVTNIGTENIDPLISTDSNVEDYLARFEKLTDEEDNEATENEASSDEFVIQTK